MLNNLENLGWKTTEREAQRDRMWAYIALGIYVLISLLWGLGADAPWDDDCPTRYFNTQDALRDPANFVSIWNRPLFVLLFALPAQLGKEAITLLMTALSAFGAWLLWQGLRTLKVPNAWLAIPFLTFQPFFFGTSRVALTEPLAAILICAGFYFLVNKKWFWYALMGGLLPLARLELSVLLLFWAWPLVQAKQWKSMPILALPLLAWNLAAGIIVGDFMYVWSETFGADAGKNRYGNTTFLHYFQRSMWVTGPVVFWFLIQGMLFRGLRRGLVAWIDGQMLFGLLLYVLFSWQMSMGNAAGFLRNLVPLVPFAALIALDGYNAGLATLLGNAWNEPQPGQASLRRKHLILMAIASGVTLLLGAAFFSKRLELHQLLVPAADYSRLIVLACLALGTLVLCIISKSAQGIGPKAVQFASLTVSTFTIGYALYQEPPLASNNNERQAVGIVADFYAQSALRDRPALVNNNWFFWVLGENPHTPRFGQVTVANMEAAKPGTIIIWDLHYSTRLAGDVSPQYLVDHPEYVELLRIGFANRGEAVLMLEKVGTDPQQQEITSSTFADANPKFLPAIVARSFRLLAVRRFEEALALFEFALRSVKNDPDLWFGHGYALLNLTRFQEATNSLNNAVALAPRFPSAWYNLGRAYAGAGDYPNGIAALNRALAFDPLAEEAWFSRGAIKAKMHDIQGAIADFSQALSLRPTHVQALSNRAAAYAMTGQPDLALADISRARELQPQELEFLFVNGRILQQMGQKEEGCKLMRQAVESGFTKAAEFLAKQCDTQSAADSLQPPR